MIVEGGKAVSLIVVMGRGRGGEKERGGEKGWDNTATVAIAVREARSYVAT